MSEIHSAAQTGFTSGAESYVQGRPEYPRALLDWLGNALGAGRGRRIVDLGAGTGKFTKLLAQTGADLVAVEPVAAMRAQLERSVPGVQVLEGTAEAIPLASASVDALVCAQAFHWFATEAALREIHRVLKPEGRLGLVWNVRDESLDWVAAASAIIKPYEGEVPRFHKGHWRRAFSGKYFALPEPSVFAHAHTGSAQQVIVERFLSVSFIAALPADEKAMVAERLRALIDTHPALRRKETVTLPYRTEAYCCTRLP
jgi:ubiquinone/menaquinone biosynthesis C-methylase UbiE